MFCQLEVYSFGRFEGGLSSRYECMVERKYDQMVRYFKFALNEKTWSLID